MPCSTISEDFGMKPIIFKGICQLLSLYGNYEDGTNIKMSWRTMAEQAGVDRKTAFKVRDILVANGLLIETQKLSTNISVYNFGPKVPFEDLRGPFTDIDNGHNSIDYLNIIEEEESSFHSDSFEDNSKINTEEVEILFESVNTTPVEDYKEIPAALPKEDYWKQKAEEIWG